MGRHKQVIKTALPEGGQRGSSHSVRGCTNPSTWVTNLQIEQIRITVRDGFMIRIGDGAQFRIGDEAQSSVQDWVILEIEQIPIAVRAEFMVRVGDG